MAIGIGLAVSPTFSAVGFAAATPPPSWLTGVTVLGDMTLASAQVNTTQGTDSGVTFPSNGWMMRVASNLGAISSCDPTKVTLSVSDYGWNTDGTQATRNRTITGTTRVKKMGAADSANFTDADQAVGTVEFALDQQIYNDSTTDSSGRTYRTIINSITFATGFLNGSSASGLVTSGITRSDSAPYDYPLWKAVHRPEQRVSGATFYIEHAVVDAWAQQGQQVACVECWATTTGSTADTTIARASSMTDSVFTSDGLAPSGFRVPVYATTVDTSALSDGDAYIRSRVKPWIGPLRNSFDTGIGDDWPSHNLLKGFPIVKDAGGTYAPVYAWVNRDGTGLTGASTAGVSTGTSDPGSGNSYQSFAAAATAIRSWRNTNRSHNFADGGVIMLRDIAGSTEGNNATAYHVAAAFDTVPCQKLPLTIQRASGSAASDLCRIRGTDDAGVAIADADKLITSRTVFKWIKLDSVGTAGGTSSRAIAVATSNTTTLPNTSTVKYTEMFECVEKGRTNQSDDVILKQNMMYEYRSTRQDSFRVQSAGATIVFNSQSIAIGCVISGASTVIVTNLLGCLVTSTAKTTFGQANSHHYPSDTGCKQPIVFNTKFDLLQVSNNNPAPYPYALGCGWVGVLARQYGNGGALSSPFMRTSADQESTPVPHIILQNVSIPGAGADAGSNRWNFLYNDAGRVRSDKRASIKYCAFASFANKDGDFADTVGLTTSTWASSSIWPQGSAVVDTGTNYQALRTVPALTAIGAATYWLNTGVAATIKGEGTSGTDSRRTGNIRLRCGVNAKNNVSGPSVQTGSETAVGSGIWNGYIRWPVTSGVTQLWGGLGTITNYYVNDTATSTGVLGGGTYTPKPGGDLVNRIEAGGAVAPFDMLGTAIPNNGTGAAGALQ